MKTLFGVFVEGGPFYLFTPEKIVTLSPDAAPIVRAVPAEVVDRGFRYLCAGPNGELLLHGPETSRVNLYLLPPGASACSAY